MKHPRGNRKLIRAINRTAVLNTIKTYGPISRTDIAKTTGLSGATITGITGNLIEKGLIIETDEGDSSGGRRPILLMINPHGGYVIGLKLSEDHITGALTDLESTVIVSKTHTLRSREINPVLDNLVKVVYQLVEKANIENHLLIGVGVGLAGIVDANKGILRNSPIFGWQDVPLFEELQSRLNVPVFIDNDVNTLTITEQWFGIGQGVENFITVTIGRGVGMGMVLNGQIYLGGAGGAGEFGHTVIDPNGSVCDCGKRGCLETFVADPWLLRNAKEKISDDVSSIVDLLRYAEQNNANAIEIYTTAGKVLGRGIANLINVLNPELVIISGEGVRAGDLLFKPMRDSIKKHVMPGFFEDTRIQIDVWEDDAWARGASGLVLRYLFESPILNKEIVFNY